MFFFFILVFLQLETCSLFYSPRIIFHNSSMYIQNLLVCQPYHSHVLLWHIATSHCKVYLPWVDIRIVFTFWLLWRTQLSVLLQMFLMEICFHSLGYIAGSESGELYLIHFILRNLHCSHHCLLCSYYCGQAGTIYCLSDSKNTVNFVYFQ